MFSLGISWFQVFSMYFRVFSRVVDCSMKVVIAFGEPFTSSIVVTPATDTYEVYAGATTGEEDKDAPNALTNCTQPTTSLETTVTSNANTSNDEIHTLTTLLGI